MPSSSSSPSSRRRTPRSRRPGVGTWVAAATLAVAALAACSEPTASPQPTATTSRATTTTASPRPTPKPTPAKPALGRLTGGPVFAAKIDNTSASRPRQGVSSADVVYVEPVEAGLTRVLAVWSSKVPAEVGPIRSGRESDVDILANYGKVAFAFSGASAGTLATLGRGGQVDLSNDASGVGFRRASDRRAPYNVMGNTSVLLQRAGGSVKPGDPGFRFGPQLTGGRSGSVVRTAWPASRIELRWDAGAHRYLVTTDGQPDVDADGSRHAAATVVVQHVPTTLSANRDVNGVQSPLAQVVGTGRVDVLRDGKVWSGRWVRTSPSAPTSFLIGSTVITMASGPVWVLLVPNGQAVTIG